MGDGNYSGSADDVVGLAKGASRGNAFRWGYTLALPVDGCVWEVQFDDWMYLMSERVMLNKATMSKWGVKLGEVAVTANGAKIMGIPNLPGRVATDASALYARNLFAFSILYLALLFATLLGEHLMGLSPLELLS